MGKRARWLQERISAWLDEGLIDTGQAGPLGRADRCAAPGLAATLARLTVFCPGRLYRAVRLQHRLAPGETYTVALDLSEPRWYVSVDGNSGEIGRYANNDSFRIVYQTPSAALDIAGELAWRGELPSSAFTAFRILD